jgi:hypothetical protein
MRNWSARKFHHLIGRVLVGGAVTCGAYAQTSGSLPLDTPTTVDGIETVCTGVAVDPADMPRWNKYPLKVVVAGKNGQFLAGEEVSVSQGDHKLVSATCDGPWLLFKLPPGEYRVKATLDGKSVESVAHVPKSGQGRIALRFPAVGGAVSPQDKGGNL